MTEHVDEVGNQRGEEPMTTQPMVSNTTQGKKHIYDICINEIFL